MAGRRDAWSWSTTVATTVTIRDSNSDLASEVVGTRSLSTASCASTAAVATTAATGPLSDCDGDGASTTAVVATVVAAIVAAVTTGITTTGAASGAGAFGDCDSGLAATWDSWTGTASVTATSSTAAVVAAISSSSTSAAAAITCATS